MVRFVIIGIVIAAAFTLYALVDAAMSDSARSRGVSKPVWVVLIVVLPVIGAILWFTIGKARGPLPAPARAPEDDPRFAGTSMSDAELESHMRELEERLRELDAETFPGEQSGAGENGGSAESAAGVDEAQDPGAAAPEPGPAAPSEEDAPGEPRRPDRPGESPTSLS